MSAGCVNHNRDYCCRHNTLNGVLDANSTADISGNTTIGGTLGVTGVSTLGEIDASGVADIADTLTLSKATGNGLSVTASADIGGNLVVSGSLSVVGTATFFQTQPLIKALY